MKAVPITGNNSLSAPRHGNDFITLDIAFQPVVNAHTGCCFGCEVLLRGHEALGFPSVAALLDDAHAAGLLAEIELIVRRKAASTLAGLLQARPATALFFNLSPRLLPMAKDFQKATRKTFAPHTRLVTEITDRPDGEVGEWVKALKKHGALLAIDRFGEGNLGLRMLHESDPDILKIDPYCITNIDADARKRVVLAQIVSMAHTLGMLVVAVGIETEREFLVCRDLGCDMVQGIFIQPPVTDPALLQSSYPHVEMAATSDRRRRRLDLKWILDQVDPILPVKVDAPIKTVFERFAHDLGQTLIPVVDNLEQPLGIVRERNLKNYAYSTFGKDLIANKGIGRCLRDFVVHCPIAEISVSLDQILAIFSTNEDADGIIVTEQMHYAGFLSARSIIRAIHEKSLAHAREANPLSKLPGNERINDYLTSCLSSDAGYVFAYVDFDNFKPFNDTYGFRQGDRAILLFADLMRKAATPEWFLGHIGGDDFFVGMRSDLKAAERAIGQLIAHFSRDAESFYDAEARSAGCITAQDRDGKTKTFPLLSASAVLIEIPAVGGTYTVDDISTAIAAKKKAAKTSPTRIATTALGAPLPEHDRERTVI